MRFGYAKGEIQWYQEAVEEKTLVSSLWYLRSDMRAI
jgi:hypothetical protein